jgi:hypothetical protein
MHQQRAAAPEPCSEPAVSPPVAVSPAGSVIARPSAGAPEGLAADSTTGVLAVGVRNPNGVILLDLAEQGVRARIGLRQPNDVTIDDATGTIIVAGAADNNLEFITPVLR